MTLRQTFVSCLTLAFALTASAAQAKAEASAAAPATANAPTSAAGSTTPAEVRAFLAEAEKRYEDMSNFDSQASWINETYITDDTDAVASRVGTQMTELLVDYAGKSARYRAVPGLTPAEIRKLDLMRGALTLPAPSTPGSAAMLNTLGTKLQSAYGKGKGTLRGQPINGSDIEAEMGTNRDPAELKEMWLSWHDNVGAPMRADYARLVDIANAGARELGYADTGAMWRSQYDMPPEDFAALMDRIWDEVKPLYDDLHCFVRAKLNAKYGDAVQPKTGAIRADLLGNMWAQSWDNIYDLVAPAGIGDIGYDVGELLKAKGYDPLKMVKAGEGFYTSLGLAPLPESFWQRSMFVKPQDREVVCHASAWDLDNLDDLRIKMCIKVNGDDFVTIHHELGHNFYQRAYKSQPMLFKNGANDGFHEAIGDFIALSVTPDYLVKIGLLDPAKVPGADKDIGLLLRKAMEKVAFLPFGLLVDKWRWGVFDGSIGAGSYETGWNDLRLKYQGVVPPVARDEGSFDPAAKFHIPANVPYARYFLAAVLQFQFYEAACKQAGWKGPLHRCSFYGNRKVGAKFNQMLGMGQSKPWPDALQAFTGSREMSGKAMLAYFAPLSAWLKKENAGKSCGW